MLWRKPLPDGKTAVLAINGAMLPHNITIDFGNVLAPDFNEGTLSHRQKFTATDVWTGGVDRSVTSVTKEVRPHSNIFLVLE